MTIEYYNTKNKVKPRFDNGGSEFGLAHRDLGPGYLMFDIDKMSAKVELNLELHRKETGFVEYRHNKDEIKFVALFEIKHKRTPYSLAAVNPENSSTLATIEMAKKLGCRLFVVYGNENKPPFEFNEYFPDNNQFEFIGELKYQPETREQNIKKFWKEVLKIDR